MLVILLSIITYNLQYLNRCPQLPVRYSSNAGLVQYLRFCNNRLKYRKMNTYWFLSTVRCIGISTEIESLMSSTPMTSDYCDKVADVSI